MGWAGMTQLPSETRVVCLRGVEGLAPHTNGEMYYQAWDAKARATRLAPGERKYDHRFSCKEQDDGSLMCAYGNWGKQPRRFPNFFGRMAYHLFSSAHKFFPGWQAAHRQAVKSPEDILSAGWLLSEMYRRSFNLPEAVLYRTTTTTTPRVRTKGKKQPGRGK